MFTKTYRGVVRDGKVEADALLGLAEGSEVYVVVPTHITLDVARRRTNAWLVGYVGNLLMAEGGILVQGDTEWMWRFDILITSPGHPPWGPIGTVEIDAATGDIVHPERTKEMLQAHARSYQADQRSI